MPERAERPARRRLVAPRLPRARLRRRDGPRPAPRRSRALVAPGDAEAYHFCGHIYTTDSCPHPTGLPRIDRKGFPLRAKDGHPIDDLGRLIDADGRAVDEDGAPADGRRRPRRCRPPAARASATPSPTATASTRPIDGAWFRCCGGQVRKLVDCCSYSTRRINGDASLTGYCYKGRRVFCVMYYDTKVKC